MLPFRLDAKIPYLSISLHEEAMKSHVNSTFIQYTGNNVINHHVVFWGSETFFDRIRVRHFETYVRINKNIFLVSKNI